MTLSLIDRPLPRQITRVALAGAALLCSLLLLGATAPPALAAVPSQAGCPGNLLANPGFDGGQRKTESLGTSLSSSVADGWFPWFVRGNDETWNREPEFKLNIPGHTGDAYRVRGGNSMKWFTTWATHDAGVYQRVAVQPGATVSFSAWGMIYSGEADGHRPDLNTFFSDPDKNGSYRMQVGIDPHGNLPSAMGAPPPDTVQWSAENFTMDQFVQQSVATAARAGAVTVYVRGKAIWPVKHNNSFWEDACLRYGAAGAAPAEVPAPPAEELAAEAPPAEEVAQAATDEDAVAVDAADEAPETEPSAAEVPEPPARSTVVASHSRKASGQWARPR